MADPTETTRSALSLVEAIDAVVLEAVLALASRIGRATRSGRPGGACFVIGDLERTLAGAADSTAVPLEARESVIDPTVQNRLCDEARLSATVALSADGWIVARGIQLAPPSSNEDAGLDLSERLGIDLTSRNHAVAITVAASDGVVRAFLRGGRVLQMDPDVAGDPPS